MNRLNRLLSQGIPVSCFVVFVLADWGYKMRWVTSVQNSSHNQFTAYELEAMGQFFWEIVKPAEQGHNVCHATQLGSQYRVPGNTFEVVHRSDEYGSSSEDSVSRRGIPVFHVKHNPFHYSRFVGTYNQMAAEWARQHTNVAEEAIWLLADGVQNESCSWSAELPSTWRNADSQLGLDKRDESYPSSTAKQQVVVKDSWSPRQDVALSREPKGNEVEVRRAGEDY